MNDARVQEIRSAAEGFREAIEQSDWNLNMDEYYILRDLRAMCKPAAMLVGKYLREGVDALREQQRGAGVPEVVETDVGQSCLL